MSYIPYPGLDSLLVVIYLDEVEYRLPGFISSLELVQGPLDALWPTTSGVDLSQTQTDCRQIIRFSFFTL